MLKVFSQGTLSLMRLQEWQELDEAQSRTQKFDEAFDPNNKDGIDILESR